LSADTGCNSGGTFGTGAAISGTDTQPLYQVERHNTPSFTCTYAVSNGTYAVTLKFAEISIETTGQRLFHVDLNGTRVLSSFDVYATAGGPNKAVDRTFPVTVTGGQVSLVFTALMSSATVSAIEILPTGGSGGTPFETRYTYNLNNQVTNVSMPRGGTEQTRTFNYNAITQRLESVTNPETGTTIFNYGGDGTLDYKIDAKGAKVKYFYDTKQRVIEIQRMPDGVNQDPCQRVELKYDTNPMTAATRSTRRAGRPQHVGLGLFGGRRLHLDGDVLVHVGGAHDEEEAVAGVWHSTRNGSDVRQ
jgi:hypothetical protein